MSNLDWLQEFAESGIGSELALANAQWVEGDEAVEAFLGSTLAQRQRVSSYVTAGNAQLIQRYQFLEAGGWIAHGETLDGSPGEVPYFKPAKPRWDTGRNRPIKYETPPLAQALPLLPIMPGQSWRDFLDTQQPVVVCEGLKKALAALEQGQAAIALRGITQWHPKGSFELCPALAQIAKGRVVVIAFDQDDKLRTRADVARQTTLLATAIEKAGGIPRIMQWDKALGKGLDDALVGLYPEQRGPWLEQAIARSLTLAEYRRVATVAKAKSILAIPAPKAQRETVGFYLPILPPLTKGTIHWLAAGMGSGKTYRIGRDWVRAWIQAGGVVVVLSPLNALGQQTAQDWELPHLHDYGTKGVDREALEADISHRGGVVACFNSAHRVRELIPGDRPLLLVIDEAAQTLDNATEGGTLKSEWAARWEDAITLMQQAATGGAIALAEDGLDQATIDLVQKLSGAALVRGFHHTREATPWPVTLNRATPLSGWRAELLASIQAGDRILYVTTSQEEGRRLERWAKQQGIDAQHRIDSETNEGGAYRKFFEAPEAWLYANLPQLLILSPSAKTGLSIEGGITADGAYFDSVWGYFPTLDTDTAMQLLGRYRPPVPRYIWAPAYIQPEPGEAPGKLTITNDLVNEAARYATYGGFGQAPEDTHDSAIKAYMAARRQRRWAQKVQAADALADRLNGSGHQVQVITEGAGDKGVAATWEAIKEELAQEDSAYHAELEIDTEVHTWEWANTVRRSIDSTREQRCKAAKVRMVSRFPGLNWDDAALWYAAAFCPRQNATADRPNRGPLAPGAALWAEAGHYQALWAEDAKEAATILGQRLKAAHLLPQNGPRAMLAAIFRPLVEKMLAAGEVVPGGEVEAQIKALALRYRAEIKRYWRLSITDDQSNAAIACKIARKFGLDAGGESNRLRRITVTGKQEWVCRITTTATWRSLVSAREFALKQQCTDVLESGSNRFVLSPPQKPAHSEAIALPPPSGTDPPLAA
ncbi:MAG: DUF3854 domain-containing protein [Nodosilinea sp.]